MVDDEDQRRRENGNFAREELDRWAGNARVDPLDAYELVGADIYDDRLYLSDESSDRLLYLLRAAFSDAVRLVLEPVGRTVCDDFRDAVNQATLDGLKD